MKAGARGELELQRFWFLQIASSLGWRSNRLNISLPSDAGLVSINCFEFGLDGEVLTEPMNLDILHDLGCEFAHLGQGNAVFAGDFGSIEEKKCVDDACRESSAVEGRSGFEKNA